MLVQGVQPTARSALCGRDVLVFPPPVDQPERGEATQRAVDGDLLDAQAVRNLESVELGRALTLDSQAFEQDLGIELEQEPTAGSGHLSQIS